MGKGASPEQVVREIQRRTRRRFSAEEKVRIVLEGLRGEQTVAELCRREGLAPNLYYLYGLPPGRKSVRTEERGRPAYLYSASGTGFRAVMEHPRARASTVGRPRWPR
jgi:Transposase